MKKKSKIRQILVLLVLTFMMVSVWQGKEVQAATDEAKAEVREIIVEMFQTGDTSTRDINDLKLTWKEFDSIYNDVIENECWLEYRCCQNTLYQTTTYKENNIDYVSDFYLMGMDPQLPEYTATAREKIEYIESQIDSKMTDLDKLVLIHDYIDRINTYNLNAEHGYIHSATGPLYFGSSVCDGYAKAMNLLLNAVGVETDTISNDGHRWSLVKIDGEYYHVDPTWDDTRCYKTGTYKTHYFMMRNDDEYRNDPYSPHVGFGYHDYVNNVDVTTFSTSTKYTDWYVHSVIGDMYYYDGYWYYVLNNAIRKNNIQGTDESVLFTGTNLTITGIEDGVLYFSKNGTSKHIDLSKKAVKVGTPVIKSVTNKKGKKLSITLKKKVSGATGYEVKISTNKNFKKSVKTVYFTKTSTTITKLTKNKTYYVKVRAYKKDSKGKKIYGSYSTVKKIKIKK